MKKMILIHGMSSVLDESFGIGVKKRLEHFGFDITEPIFPVNQQITYEKWNDVIDRCVEKIDKETCFLCHSLGCLFAIKYLFRKKATCNTVIAVAGGNPSAKHPLLQQFPNLKQFAPTQEEFDYFKNHVGKVYDICSNNDHLLSPEVLEEYIKKTGAEKMMLENRGHFGRTSNQKDIPEIDEILKKIK